MVISTPTNDRLGETIQADMAKLAVETDAALRAKIRRALVWAHCARGEVQQAVEAAQSIEDEADRSAALASFALYRAVAGESDAVAALLDELHDPKVMIETWRALAELQAHEGDIAAAQDTLRAFGEVRKSLQADDSISEAAFEDMAGLQMQLGDQQGAQETAHQLPEGKRRDLLLESFSARQVLVGDQDGAAAFALQIADTSRRERVLEDLDPDAKKRVATQSSESAQQGKSSGEVRWS